MDRKAIRQFLHRSTITKGWFIGILRGGLEGIVFTWALMLCFQLLRLPTPLFWVFAIGAFFTGGLVHPHDPTFTKLHPEQFDINLDDPDKQWFVNEMFGKKNDNLFLKHFLPAQCLGLMMSTIWMTSSWVRGILFSVSWFIGAVIRLMVVGLKNEQSPPPGPGIANRPPPNN